MLSSGTLGTLGLQSTRAAENADVRREQFKYEQEIAKQEKEKKNQERKASKYGQKYMEMGGTIVGGVAGALIGGIPTAGAGALPGAAVGASLGRAVGGLASGGINMATGVKDTSGLDRGIANSQMALNALAAQDRASQGLNKGPAGPVTFDSGQTPADLNLAEHPYGMGALGTPGAGGGNVGNLGSFSSGLQWDPELQMWFDPSDGG